MTNVMIKWRFWLTRRLNFQSRFVCLMLTIHLCYTQTTNSADTPQVRRNLALRTFLVSQIHIVDLHNTTFITNINRKVFNHKSTLPTPTSPSTLKVHCASMLRECMY